jgi:formylglycine-generating enzyme required for sulfatase activity
MSFKKVFFAFASLLFIKSIYAQGIDVSNKKIVSKRQWRNMTKKITPEGFVFVKGGSFTSSNFDINPDKDSSVLISEAYKPSARRITISSLIISKYEVTNKEYKEFVNWVKDSIALTILAEKDPAFYKDASLKRLDWSKRNTVLDTIMFSNLYPLYIKNDISKNGGYMLNTRQIKYKIIKEDRINFDINIYPDTLVWYRDNNVWDQQLGKIYFFNETYANFPVVGVSWQQANAYCNWLTRNKLNNLEENNQFFHYRLPTSSEFEYCQSLQNPFFNKNNTRKYPIISNELKIIDDKGNYLANFGPIIDKNNFVIKSDLYSPAKVGSYPMWWDGLYDIAGNVSEWVLDGAPENIFLDNLNFTRISNNIKFNKIDSITKSNMFISRSDSFSTILKKMYAYLGYEDGYNFWLKMGSPMDEDELSKKIGGTKITGYKNDVLIYLINMADQLIHDFDVLNKLNNPKFVMGGSWHDGPAFMMKGIKQAYSENESHSTIGFRVFAGVRFNENIEIKNNSKQVNFR